LPPEAIIRQTGVPLLSLRQLNPAVGSHTEQIIVQALELRTSARHPSAKEFLEALITPMVQGRPCPKCGKPPVTPNAPFCHACGAPILLLFTSIGRQIDDPAALEDTCDRAWQDALKHLQSGLLMRWLSSYNQPELITRLQEAQSRYQGDPEAILEAFVRPHPPQDLAADRKVLDFGACALDAAPSLTITLQRPSPGYTHGTAHAEKPWVTLSTQTIRLHSVAASATLVIGVDLAQLASGDAQRRYSSAVVISTNRGSLRLPVEIVVSNPPRPRIQPSVVQLGKIESLRRTSGSVAIVNEGGGVISGIVRAEQPWLTVEAQNAQFSLGYYQHATVHFSVTTEQLTPRGSHRGTLVWETDQGGFITDVYIDVTIPYAVEPSDTTTAIRQIADLVKLCDHEARRGANNWERGCSWLRNGRITAALLFLGEDVLARRIEEYAQESDVNVGLERGLRALGARPAQDYKDNSGEVIRQITGIFSRKPPVVEYAILNTSKRGYLHGFVRPLANWIGIPEPRFGCMPGEESIVKLYPDYKQRAFGDLFEAVVE
jgi:hypothetical protein